MSPGEGCAAQPVRSLLDAALPPDAGSDPLDGLLAQGEHRAMELTVDLYHRLTRIVQHGPSRQADLTEVAFHLHALQRMVLAQAAARAFPHRYRLLGGGVPGPAGVV